MTVQLFSRTYSEKTNLSTMTWLTVDFIFESNKQGRRQYPDSRVHWELHWPYHLNKLDSIAIFQHWQTLRIMEQSFHLKIALIFSSELKQLFKWCLCMYIYLRSMFRYVCVLVCLCISICVFVFMSLSSTIHFNFWIRVSHSTWH